MLAGIVVLIQPVFSLFAAPSPRPQGDMALLGRIIETACYSSLFASLIVFRA